MTKLNLDEIMARCEAATPGDWYPTPIPPRGDGDVLTTSDIFIDVDRELNRTIITTYEGRADQTFICHARTDIPALVERVKELESVLREALARQAMQHTGPMIGGACTEACVKCEARRLLDGGK
jgi:hypothetical protein